MPNESLKAQLSALKSALSTKDSIITSLSAAVPAPAPPPADGSGSPDQTP